MVVAFRKVRQASPNGFIIVAVLWILAGLSALISIYAAYVVQAASAHAIYDDRFRAQALTSAAIELTAYQQLSTPEASRPTSGWFSFRLGAATVSVEYRSETSRIDLNSAPKPVLAGLFTVLGAGSDAAENYADRVVGWRTPATPDNDRETSIYQGLGYGPRGGKFPHVNELALVRDLPPLLVERALPFITVYSGRPQVNIFDAAQEVVAALPGMTRENINGALAHRGVAPEAQKQFLAKLGSAQQFTTMEGSKAIRSQVAITFDHGFRSNSEVVLLLVEQDHEPFSILSWRDSAPDGDR
jgi:general secretion pathway protein K